MLSWLSELIFPPSCLICQRFLIKNDLICNECKKDLRLYPENEYCYNCGQSLISKTHSLCLTCIPNPPPFTYSKAIYIYNEAIAKLISRFKFFDDLRLGNFFANLMLEYGTKILQNTNLIIPVPLSKQRLYKRKYNQSAIISNLLSKALKIPKCNFSLVRVKNTVPQTQLTGKKRLNNMKNAFALTQNVNIINSNIALIDDVMTTGSTARNCAKALIKGGASEVKVLALARTVK